MMGRPRWSGTVLLAIGLAALVSGPMLAIAQTDAPASYTGDLWSRPRLTGDWWESRDWLAQADITLDLDLLQVLQGVATGGRDTGVEYDGLVNYELNLDTGKLGLWPGGFLKVKAFTGYGDTVDQDSGAIVPVNMLGLLPQPDNPTTTALDEPLVHAVPQPEVRDRPRRQAECAGRRRERLRARLSLRSS